jgi:hypothetical protein
MTINPKVLIMMQSQRLITRNLPLILELHLKITNKGTPQQAYSMGLEYRDPKYWWIGQCKLSRR